MGQYGNQPDFGTIVASLTDIGQPFPPSAIYVGATTDNDGTASLQVVSVNGNTFEITGISSGTFLPFIVTEITSREGVANDDILLYR
jgi:hypothetical protein